MLVGSIPWPSAAAEYYRHKGYWRGEVLGDLLKPWARSEPGRTALVHRGRPVTYGELDGRADRLAAGLASLGVRPPDRVVVQLANTPEFVISLIALFRLGGVPVLALPSHRRSEITYLCRHTEAVAYVAPDVYQGFDYRTLAAEVRATVPTLRHVLIAGNPGNFRGLAELEADPVTLAPPSPGNVAFLLLSGGTTGVPKLIPRTHDDYAFQLRATAAEMGMDHNGVYLAALPVAHNAALGCPGVLGTLSVGGKVVLATSPSPDEVFPLIQREQVTLTTLMPMLLMVWLEAAEVFEVDMSRVVIEVGGAMLSREVARRVRPVLGARLTHWFGMAEGPLSFTRLGDAEELAFSSQGRPLSPDDEFRIVDDLDCELSADAIGHLIVRGPTTLRGYYRAEQHNAQMFTADGFLRTGDLARITPEGLLVIEGRVKDVINRGGEKVSAEELEDHLLGCPGVRSVAVVAVPDEIMGEKTCAVVVPQGGPPTLDELRRWLGQHGLAEYKLPDRLVLVDRLPHTSVGKIDKAALRDLLRG